MIEVRFFASLREELACEHEMLEVEAAGETVAELRARLCQRGGRWATALAPERAVLAAVNQELAPSHRMLTDGDEVAFFPPVTGG